MVRDRPMIIMDH